MADGLNPLQRSTAQAASRILSKMREEGVSDPRRVPEYVDSLIASGRRAHPDYDDEVRWRAVRETLIAACLQTIALFN